MVCAAADQHGPGGSETLATPNFSFWLRSFGAQYDALHCLFGPVMGDAAARKGLPVLYPPAPCPVGIFGAVLAVA